MLWQGQGQRRVADIMVRIKGVEEENEKARIWYQEGSTLRIIVKGEGRGCRVTRNPMEIAVKAAHSLSSMASICYANPGPTWAPPGDSVCRPKRIYECVHV